ncbi:hypothetical protein [Sediminicoccus sp. KRV36]|uniref:cell division protein FtsL n=1 Tax=Sediminicoccus sp. KRV36 TaxID=3133721 RepID=UPI00200C0B0C|nr:hypothetical protein [Sediminicoccus rosea]UPY38196.1 hypothetical protein LHU95_05730 [Sediminicoccus rosea]
MIHPLTLITFAAFLGSGLYVFQTKEEVAKLDRELREIRRETEAERGRTQTLSAEWARLNDQDRLRQMAAAHLRHMQPMEPAQFQRIEDAQRRMPLAVAFTPLPSGFQRRADAPSAPGDVLVFTAASQRREAEPVSVAAAPRPASTPTAGPAAAPAPAPAQVAAAAAPVVTPAPAPVPASTPAVTVAAAPRAAEARPSEPRPAPRPRPEVAALPPIAGPAAAPRAQYAQGNVPSPIAAPPQALRTALHVQPAPSGSMLGGGAGSLPPPVPFSR